ncbi:MAG: hypothetical protein CMK06_05080 [Ponticaulis sp.]|nr:hypothetical protein [Ponticaulis sp.]
MSDIFEEVDEALAHDNYAKLWHNIRWFVYGLIALIILGVGGWEIMKWNDARTQEAYAEEFYAAQQALQANDYVAANALFEEILNSDSPFAEMAAHYVALNQFTNMGDRRAAVAALTEAGNGDGAIAQAAVIKAAYLQFESEDMEGLKTLLAPVLDNPESPYAFLADEVLASKAFANGDYEDAKRRFTRLSVAIDATQATKARAQEALAVISSIQETRGPAE